MSDDLSGDLKNFMVSLMSAGRDESEDIDFEQVKQDAKVRGGLSSKQFISSGIQILCSLHM